MQIYQLESKCIKFYSVILTLHYLLTIFIDIAYHQNNVSTDLPSTIVETCKVIILLIQIWHNFIYLLSLH